MRSSLLFVLITIFRTYSALDYRAEKSANDETSEDRSVLPILRSLGNSVGNSLEHLTDGLSENFARIDKDVTSSSRALRFIVSPIHTPPFWSTLEPIPGILAERVKKILSTLRFGRIDDRLFEREFETYLADVENQLDLFSTLLEQNVRDRRRNVSSANSSGSRYRRNYDEIRLASRRFTNAYEETTRSIENRVIERDRKWNSRVDEFVEAMEDAVHDINECSDLCWMDERDKKDKLDTMLRITYTLKAKTEYEINSFEATVKGRLNEMKIFVQLAVSKLFHRDRIFQEIYFSPLVSLQNLFKPVTNVPIEIMAAVNVTAATAVRSAENATSAKAILSTENATFVGKILSMENVTSTEKVVSTRYDISTEQVLSTRYGTSTEGIVPIANFTAAKEAVTKKSAASKAEVIFAINSTSSTVLWSPTLISKLNSVTESASTEDVSIFADIYNDEDLPEDIYE